jgi:hypothetical protein
MRRCWHRKLYHVLLNKIKTHSDGNGWSNFIATPYLNQARYYAKKLKLKYRQIDVRERGKKPYVLKGSWL